MRGRSRNCCVFLVLLLVWLVVVGVIVVVGVVIGIVVLFGVVVVVGVVVAVVVLVFVVVVVVVGESCPLMQRLPIHGKSANPREDFQYKGSLHKHVKTSHIWDVFP